MEQKPHGEIWLDLARAYVAMKWPDAAANSRSGMVESMVTVTVALVADGAGRPSETVLRQAIAAHITPSVPDDETLHGKLALEWLRHVSVPVASLAEPSVVRRGLDAVALRLDGTLAAPSTRRRKRAIFYNALEFAIERGLLEHNPIDRLRVKSRRKRVAQTVDRRVVANPWQVRSLLIAVSMIGGRIKDRGLRLVAFFACMYFAAMRPEEAAGLREQDCYLPGHGWGRLTLEVARTDVGKKWTDTGDRHEARGLKHRADNETRSVPIPPELVELLRWHVATFGVAPDGRLFRSVNGGVVGSTTYARVWQEARRVALTPAQSLSVLAGRPYDLRHAAVSLWLNSGVPATEVADRAGQSVKVLLEIYAKCVDGDEAIMNARIESTLA
jgi:integrase